MNERRDRPELTTGKWIIMVLIPLFVVGGAVSAYVFGYKLGLAVMFFAGISGLPVFVRWQEIIHDWKAEQ